MIFILNDCGNFMTISTSLNIDVPALATPSEFGEEFRKLIWSFFRTSTCDDEGDPGGQHSLCRKCKAKGQVLREFAVEVVDDVAQQKGHHGIDKLKTWGDGSEKEVIRWSINRWMITLAVISSVMAKITRLFTLHWPLGQTWRASRLVIAQPLGPASPTP